jgi:hypothetical protein
MAIEIGPGWTIGGGISIVHPPPPPNAGWFGGGYFVTPSSSPGQSSMIARITYATDTATASVRGPLNTQNYDGAAIGNDDYGWFGGGYRGPFPGTTLSTVQRITYATDSATASVRGPLSAGRKGFASTGNTTDGWFAGGFAPGTGGLSIVQRITYATDTAAASVRGPLTAARYQIGGTADTTYGWFARWRSASSYV